MGCAAGWRIGFGCAKCRDEIYVYAGDGELQGYRGSCFYSREVRCTGPIRNARNGYEGAMTAPSQFPKLPAYPVKQRLEAEGVNVVLLSVPPNEHLPENIFGLTEKGDVLWQVEPRPCKEPNTRYTLIRDEIGLVVGETEDRCVRKIDPKTGKVLHEDLPI